MMDPRRFTELCELMIDSELSPADAAELRAHLEADPAAVTAMHAAAQEHVLCRTALRPADAALLAERTRHMLESWRPASGEMAAARVMARIDQRRSVAAWRWWGGLAAAAMLMVGVGVSFMWLGAGSSTVPDGEPPRVTALAGEVWQAGGGQLAVGHALAVHEGMEVGAGANATLTWSDGTTIRIASGSRLVRLPGAGQRMQLERGAVSVQATHRPASVPMEIVCPDTTTRVVGTAFMLTVKDGRSRLAVTDGLVRLTRSADGVASLVGVGQQVSAATLPLPVSMLMSPEQLAAVRNAIAAGREPWAGSWAAVRQREAQWLAPSAAPSAVVEVPAYNGGNPAHSAARLVVSDATQPALGLALIARLGNDERAAAAAVRRIRAWLLVRVQGPEADIVVCDTAIALVQAADLLRGMSAWTARDGAALEAWIQSSLAPEAARLLTSGAAQARWRGVVAAMTIAAWHGDQAGVRAYMTRMRLEIASEFAPASLARLLAETGEKRELLQDILLALQCADLARLAAGDATPPPPVWATAVSGFIAHHAKSQPIDSNKTYFMRALVGPGPWRTSAAQPFVVGPDLAPRVVFGWAFPTLTARDPRW